MKQEKKAFLEGLKSYFGGIDKAIKWKDDLTKQGRNPGEEIKKIFSYAEPIILWFERLFQSKSLTDFFQFIHNNPLELEKPPPYSKDEFDRLSQAGRVFTMQLFGKNAYNNKFSKEQYLEVTKEIFRFKNNIENLAKEFGIDTRTLKKWMKVRNINQPKQWNFETYFNIYKKLLFADEELSDPYNPEVPYNPTVEEFNAKIEQGLWFSKDSLIARYKTFYENLSEKFIEEELAELGYDKFRKFPPSMVFQFDKKMDYNEV